MSFAKPLFRKLFMNQLQHLHAMYTKDVLMPRFVMQFQCNGPDCPLSCCTYFRVNFGKKDYEILEHNLALSAEHKKNYRKCSRAKRTDEGYAEFVGKNGSRICGFLEGGWCALHRDFGEAALPRPCYTYPRLYRTMGREHTELNLSISCPQVAKLALLKEDAFDFVISSMHFRKDAVVEDNASFSGDLQLILDIRFFCIQLMRAKDIALWKRVALLGLFSSQLAEILANTKIVRQIEKISQNIQQLIIATTALIESGEVNAIYEVVETDWMHLTACVNFLVDMQQHWLDGKQDDYIVHFYQEIALYLSPDGEDVSEVGSFDFQFTLHNYQQGMQHLTKSLTDYPYFFEHVLVSELLYLNFPFFNHELRLTYQHFCFVYIFTRFALAMFCVNGEKSPEELSLVVARVMRVFQHRSLLDLMNVVSCKSLGWENLSAIYAHLKDDF